MTNDYGEGPWAPAEIFVGGGGKSEKAPTCMLKRPPSPINVAEKASTWRKSNKKAPQIAGKRFFKFSSGGGGDRLLLPPPLPAPMGGGGGKLLLFHHLGVPLCYFFLQVGGGCPYGGGPGFFEGLPPPLQKFLNIAHHICTMSVNCQ